MIGLTISHYRIVSQIGSGGMGVVCEAEDTRLGRHVALKLLPADACTVTDAMQRFLREARIVSSLNHPHICTLHDIGEHDGRQFMVMELLEGESLKTRLTRGRERGMIKEAIEHLKEAVRIAPMQPLGHLNLAYAYMVEDMLPDARREFEEALKLYDSAGARGGLYAIGVVTGDQALADAQVARIQGRRDEPEFMSLRAQATGYRGQMKETARLGDELFRRAQTVNRLQPLSEMFAGLAIAQASVGRTDVARRELARLQQHSMITDGSSDEIVILGAVLGDVKLVQAHLEQAVKHLRSDSDPQDAEKGERRMRALAALVNGRDQEAYDLASAVGTELRHRDAMFVAGLAALRLKRWDDAAKSFGAIAAYRNKLGLTTLTAVANIMLARAQAGAGRAGEAREAYEEAFRIWKDADPDLPLLVEARKEYDQLRPTR